MVILDVFGPFLGVFGRFLAIFEVILMKNKVL
jgi:hypothetical protein